MIDNVVVQVIRNQWLQVLAALNVASQELVIVWCEVQRWMVTGLVNKSHMLGKLRVHVRIRLVQQEEDVIEPRHQGSWQVDVLMHTDLGVVSSVQRVCGSKNGGPGVQTRDDTSLGDRNSLLLHHLVDVGPVSLVHLVKLIDATDTKVCQDEGSTLENQLLGQWVSDDGCCEANSR